MTKSEEVRIGVTVPSVNSVVEAWYPRAVPEHVSVHFARMLMPSDATPERIIEMDRTDGVRSIRQLASCRPHAIAYGCTASSIVQGHEFDAHLRDEIREIAGCPGTSATTSIFAACAALGMQRVTAISPYVEAVDAAEHSILCRRRHRNGRPRLHGHQRRLSSRRADARENPGLRAPLLGSGERRHHHCLP